jgi:protoheme IX farnesyltransferase
MKPTSQISDFRDGALALGGPLGPATVDAAADATADDVDRDDEILAADQAAAAAVPSRWVDYYELTKPRMNFLVVVTTMVGFYMAAGGRGIDWVLLVNALLGTALTAAGSAALNQYIERDLDALMPRTRNRPLPAGRVTPVEVLVYGILLSIGGVAHLSATVNATTAVLGAVTLGTYLLVYTPLKRRTSLNTVVGAVPGAIPPMMGVTAVHGAVTPEAVALFLILFFWQMPHFLAIAIMYRRDYASGGFKMLPVVDEDLSMTSRMIVLYGMALVPASLVPLTVRMAGAAYFTAAVLMGLAFLSYGVSCAASRTRADARKLFFASIIYLPVLLAVMMADRM